MDLLLLQSERALRSAVAAHGLRLETLAASSESSPVLREEAVELLRELRERGAWTEPHRGYTAPSSAAVASFAQRVLEKSVKELRASSATGGADSVTCSAALSEEARAGHGFGGGTSRKAAPEGAGGGLRTPSGRRLDDGAAAGGLSRGPSTSAEALEGGRGRGQPQESRPRQHHSASEDCLQEVCRDACVGWTTNEEVSR